MGFETELAGNVVGGGGDSLEIHAAERGALWAKSRFPDGNDKQKSNGKDKSKGYHKSFGFATLRSG